MTTGDQLGDGDLGEPAFVAPAARNPVDRAVQRLSRCSSNQDFLEQALFELDLLAPSRTLFYNEFHLASGHARALGRPRDAIDEVTALLPCFRRWAHQNPNIQQAERSLGPYRWSDAGDLSAFYDSELYAGFFGPLGIRHQLAFALPSPEGFVVGFSLNRTEHDFSDTEVLACSLLAPYLGIMLNTPTRFVELDRTDGRIGSHPEWTLLVVNSTGAILPRAQPDGGWTGGPVLPDSVRTWIATHTRHPDLTAPLGPVCATIDEGLPCPLDVQLLQDPGGRHVLLIRESGSSGEPTQLTASLTTRQLEVLQQLASGGTNAEIARRLGISTETVKKHLTAAYRKLGVADRASALAVMR